MKGEVWGGINTHLPKLVVTVMKLIFYRYYRPQVSTTEGHRKLKQNRLIGSTDLGSELPRVTKILKEPIMILPA
jgi:hypothetical protein